MRTSEFFPVAFDIDGIVLDTPTLIWDVVTKELGLPWKIDKWVDYDIGSIIGVPTRELRPIYEKVLVRDDLPEVPGTFTALNYLAHCYAQPLLFVTSRRAAFKDAAVVSIRRQLARDVDFLVVCTDDTCEDEFRSDKLGYLKQYAVRLFVEDNWMHWERYMDNGVDIATLKYPWTTERARQLNKKGRLVCVLDDWWLLQHFIVGFVGGLRWKKG